MAKLTAQELIEPPFFSAIWLMTRAKLVTGLCRLPSSLEMSTSLEGMLAIKIENGG